MAVAMQAVLRQCGGWTWTGTATYHLVVVSAHVPAKAPRARSYPKDAARLSPWLRHLVHAPRRAGCDVVLPKPAGATAARSRSHLPLCNGLTWRVRPEIDTLLIDICGNMAEQSTRSSQRDRPWMRSYGCWASWCGPPG